MNDGTKEQIFNEEAILHSAEIYRVALRMTRKKEEAEELVQETFIQAWKSFEKYEPGTNCRAWLYAILFNKYSAARRKQFSHLKHIQEVDEFVLEHAVMPSSISEHLTDETVIEALDQLPDHFRSVVILTDVYEFKYKEVSEILGVPIGTVMSRLNRARAKLKDSLANSAIEYGVVSSEIIRNNKTQSTQNFA
jgi:RNA polymerase sigma-70 factor (ECF subfamily)